MLLWEKVVAAAGAGGVRLVRTKLLAGNQGDAAAIDRELHLALTYIREDLGLSEPLEAVLSTVDPAIGVAITADLTAIASAAAARADILAQPVLTAADLQRLAR